MIRVPAPSSSRRQGAGLVPAGVALIGVCYGLARFSYGLTAPTIAADIDLTSTASGVIGAGSYVGYCVAIVLSTALTPRWGARAVATTAGATASVGSLAVALAPGPWTLAAGVLVAGSSTGMASPPLAAAVEEWVRRPARGRAQTVVNAGTGLGVLVSGPVVLALGSDWRTTWAAFAVTAALVAAWTHRVVPPRSRRGPQPQERSDASAQAHPADRRRLVAASVAFGLASIAVWTFGRDVAERAGMSSGGSALLWTVLGAAGIVGAASGDVVARVGVPRAWATGCLLLALGTLGLGLGSAHELVAYGSAAVFGASYIALTGVVLVWAVRVWPGEPSRGVGTGFLALAVGQAAGAPALGIGLDHLGSATTFSLAAAVAVVAAAMAREPRPRPATSASPSAAASRPPGGP